MRRRARNQLSPWIEGLILSYDHRRPDEAGEAGEAGGRSRSSAPLRAHVVGVDELTPSQVQCSDGGPTGLLFLSDGVLRIPAVLTASGWEHLQEREERETFTGLVHATVSISDFRMRFYMNPELNKCRFFLSVGRLDTMSVGVPKEVTHCCTTLSSVRGKMAETWRALLGLEDSQRSQECLDLSELLGEWYQECLQAVLEDIRSRLTAPQPSTSSSPPATRWDVDRVRYKGERPFSVPVRCLLMPEEDPLQLEANPPPPPPPPDAERPTPPPATEGQSSPLPVEDGELHQHHDVLTELTERPLSNPWDIFTPPCISSSSSDASPETTTTPPPPPLPPPVASKPEHVSSFFTSTQLPIDASKESSTFLPPYQNPPISLDTSLSSGPSPPDQRCAATTGHDPPQEQRDAKRKRSDEEKEEEEEEEEVSGNPPTWILDSGASGSEVGISPDRPPVQRKTPSAHDDGAAFSYSYRASGQNLQDFSRFRVTESLLRFAIKYLVGPGPTGNPPDIV